MSSGDGLDLAALRRAEAELDASEAGRGSAHVRQLRAALSMLEVFRHPDGLELRAIDSEFDDIDLTGQRILTIDTRWTLDLHNAYAWL